MKYSSFIALTLGVSGIVATIVGLGLFQSIELNLTDRLFATQPIDSRIVVLGVDTKSLEELGQWPLPRALIAEGLQKVLDAGPAGVGIDVLFADPSRLGGTDDAALEAVFRDSQAPITLPVEALTVFIKGAATPYATESIATLPQFTGKKIQYGHINLIKDRDGVVRRFPERIDIQGELIPSFSSQVVGVRGPDPIEKIVWSGQPGSVPHISFSDVLNGKVDMSRFEGAYVFFGATATDLHDEQTTPTSAGTAMAGVEIQAQIGNMLLKDLSLTPLSFPLTLLWLAALILIPAALFFFVRSISIALIVSVLLFGANITLITSLFARGISVNLTHTSLAILLSAITSFAVRYFILERERREIRGVFSKYVSGAVLEELLKNPSAVKLGGSEAEVTIFFSDIRGFTTLSETLTPAELTDLLNRYLTRMTDVVLENGGVVDKYIGDAIMAFWGAPLKNKEHVYHAIHSSLVMLEALDAFNAENEANGDPKINIGIGLNTGKVIVGNMGSSQRFDYTIMGDAVNLGSRIEGQTKTYGVRLLISEMGVAALAAIGHSDTFFLREVDKVTVKGKKEPVALFEVVEKKKEAAVRSILADFEKLRTLYYEGSWKEAAALGETILKTIDDGPTKVLTERAHEFVRTPPPHWNGVYELTSK